MRDPAIGYGSRKFIRSAGRRDVAWPFQLRKKIGGFGEAGYQRGLDALAIAGDAGARRAIGGRLIAIESDQTADRLEVRRKRRIHRKDALQPLRDGRDLGRSHVANPRKDTTLGMQI